MGLTFPEEVQSPKKPGKNGRLAQKRAKRPGIMGPKGPQTLKRGNRNSGVKTQFRVTSQGTQRF